MSLCKTCGLSAEWIFEGVCSRCRNKLTPRQRLAFVVGLVAVIVVVVALGLAFEYVRAWIFWSAKR